MGKILQICNELNNVGDSLAPIITEELFGHMVLKVFKNMPSEWEGKPILAGLGSFLGYYGEWPLHVWGTGFEPGYIDRESRANPGSRREWKIHAVRGHVTRTILKLSDDVPVGDPAILMPLIYTPQSAPHEKIRYFLHFNNLDHFDLDFEIPVVSTRLNPFKAIDLIVSSNFVFTEALHVAILAHAYSIPWAWSLNKHTRGMVKWFDWFSSLGAEPRCFWYKEILEAEKWYWKKHHEFQIIDTEKLLKAFPNHIAF